MKKMLLCVVVACAMALYQPHVQADDCDAEWAAMLIFSKLPGRIDGSSDAICGMSRRPRSCSTHGEVETCCELKRDGSLEASRCCWNDSSANQIGCSDWKTSGKNPSL